MQRYVFVIIYNNNYHNYNEWGLMDRFAHPHSLVCFARRISANIFFTDLVASTSKYCTIQYMTHSYNITRMMKISKGRVFTSLFSNEHVNIVYNSKPDSNDWMKGSKEYQNLNTA